MFWFFGRLLPGRQFLFVLTDGLSAVYQDDFYLMMKLTNLTRNLPLINRFQVLEVISRLHKIKIMAPSSQFVQYPHHDCFIHHQLVHLFNIDQFNNHRWNRFRISCTSFFTISFSLIKLSAPTRLPVFQVQYQMANR